MQRTYEQQEIVDTALTGANMVVKAFAGTGKTTTLIEVASELQKSSLYIAFNKSIADEAQGKFPSYVDCKTIHSLAYKYIVTHKMKKKLQGFYSFDDIIRDRDITTMSKDLAFISRKIRVDTVAVIKDFCQNSAKDLAEFVKTNYPSTQDKYILEYWDNMTNEDHPAKMTHDVYLKMFHLKGIKLPYKVIYLDESQDSTPVVLDIVLSQEAQIILVGDEYQSIYEWRGAINAMANLPSSFKELYLTESFRFTPIIASMATKLTYILGNPRAIIGLGKPEYKTGNHAIICRTNISFLNLLLDAEAKGDKVFILGDLKDLWSKMYHISSLCFKQPVKYPNKELAQYKSYSELMEGAEDIPELVRLIKLTRSLSDGGGLTTNINRIKSVIVENPELATYTITTAHKSKGLEWDSVTINEDMLVLREDSDLVDTLTTGQTLELLYVAVTRAKYTVAIPPLVLDVIDNFNSLRQQVIDRLV